MRNIRFGLFFLFCLFAAFATAHAQTQTDFDGDEFSEEILVTIGAGNTLGWTAFTAASSFASSIGLGSLGSAGDHLIPANWLSPGMASIGVVELENKKINWRVVHPSGQVMEKEFGKRGNTVVSGGDFDGSGYADAAIVKKKKVVVQTDYFASTTNPTIASTTHEISFMRRDTRGKPFFMNRDGSGDLIGFARKVSNSYQLTMKDLAGNKTQVRLVGAAGRNLKEIFPIARNNGTDYVAIISRKKKRTTISVLDLAGAVVDRRTFRGKGTVLAGDYLSDPGEEIGYHKGSSFTAYNPTTKTLSTFTSGRGVAADSINVNKLGKSSSGNSNNNGGGTPPGNGIGAVCPGGTRGVAGGVLWKPEADASDARRGKPVVLFTGGSKPGRSSINVYSPSGAKVCNFTFKASSIPGINGGAEHYFSGWSGGCGSTASQIAAKAGGSVYFQGRGGVCYGPINPRSRVGGI